MLRSTTTPSTTITGYDKPQKSPNPRPLSQFQGQSVKFTVTRQQATKQKAQKQTNVVCGWPVTTTGEGAQAGMHWVLGSERVQQVREQLWRTAIGSPWVFWALEKCQFCVSLDATMQDSPAPPQARGGHYSQTTANQDKSPGGWGG